MLKGGFALIATVLPTSLRVYQTCSPSGTGGDVGAERAWLSDAADLAVSMRVEDDEFGIEGRADVAVAPVRREDGHARPAGRLDLARLLEGLAVEHGHIVLAAHGHPHLASVRREEGFVGRAADVGCFADLVRSRVDEAHRVRADGHHGEGPVVRREAHAVHEDLAPVEGREVAGLRIAQPNDAEKTVCRWVDHRDRVGELLGRVDAVVVADGNVRRGRRGRRLAGSCGGCGQDRAGGQQQDEASLRHAQRSWEGVAKPSGLMFIAGVVAEGGGSAP